MALQVVGIEEYTLNDLLIMEAASLFPGSNLSRDYYLLVANAFELPCRGCPVGRYIKARYWAEEIWKGWEGCYPEFRPGDSTEAAIMKAAIVFEVASFLIAASLEQAPFIAKNVSGEDITSRGYWLKQPVKWDVIEADATQDIAALDTLLRKQFSGLPANVLLMHLKEAVRRRTLAKNRELLFFDGVRFLRKGIGSGRIDEFVQNKLIVGLAEILKRVQRLEYSKAFPLLASLLNSLVNPDGPSNKGAFNADIVKTRFYQSRKDKANYGNYESFLDSILNKLLALHQPDPPKESKGRN
jgi:hypothetical protein